MLKNGVGRYNIFLIFTQSLLNPPLCVVFVLNPSMFWFVPCVFSSTNNFAHAQTLYRMSSLCRSYECMNIVKVNIGVLTGWKKIKQRRISFVLGYLRILWKFLTAISIKHGILAAFNKKQIQFWQPYAFKYVWQFFLFFCFFVCFSLSFGYFYLIHWQRLCLIYIEFVCVPYTGDCLRSTCLLHEVIHKKIINL